MAGRTHIRPFGTSQELALKQRDILPRWEEVQCMAVKRNCGVRTVLGCQALAPLARHTDLPFHPASLVRVLSSLSAVLRQL